MPEPSADADAGANLSATTIEPRAYGYRVGDLLQRRVLLQMPPGTTLDLGSLPIVRRPGQALELRAARQVGSELQLDYQVFYAPPAVQTLELPALQLRFDSAAGGPAQSLRIDAWPVTVAPLVPLEVSPRRGLGEMQPDTSPPLIDTHRRRQRLLAWAAALTLALLGLAQIYIGLPWWGRRQRPFAQAWRALRRLPADERRAALLQLHRALDRSHGAVLFEAQLPGFIAAHPRFAPLQADLRGFYRQSRATFFGDRQPLPVAPDHRDLLALCRACRDAERGT
ncbi:MAG: hypothetical protein ABIN96_01630 [Rubrivivax sp.]